MADYTLPKAVDYADLSAKAKAAVQFHGRILQPKWDGCALVIEVPDGEAPRALSASGKPVLSCDHLIAEIVNERIRSGQRAFDFTAVCEVWVPGWEFQDISGAFRRHSPQPDLQARWFDFVQWGQEDLSYTKRTEWMVWANMENFAGFRVVWDEADAWTQARMYKAQGGYDGAILRDASAPWRPGRSKGDLLKLKPLLSHDLLCVGVEEGVGEKTGRKTAALLCRWRPDHAYQKVATGLTNEQMASPDQLIGKIIEIEAMGYTKDGYLREPRFKGVRDDKLQPDF